MFGSRSRKSGAAVAVDSLIGRQTEILGDVRFTGGLHVDGRVRGAVTGTADEGPTSLSVGDTGSIEGDVKADSVLVHGLVIGDVYARERLMLTPSARISGDVQYQLLEMAPGATINGRLVHVTPDGASGVEEPAAGLKVAASAKEVASTPMDGEIEADPV